LVNIDKGESSQVVNTDKGKSILVCSGNEQEDDGGVHSSGSENEGNNGMLDDNEDEITLGVWDGFEEVVDEDLNVDRGSLRTDKGKKISRDDDVVDPD